MAVDWCAYVHAVRQTNERQRVALGCRPRTLGGWWFWVWYWSPAARWRRAVARALRRLVNP